MVDAKIPEGIPTGVTSPVTPAVAATPIAPAVPTEGALDRGVRSLVRFFAKLLGKPDPITGQPIVAPTVATGSAVKAANFADKVWSTANKVVDKATDVANKTVEVTKTTVNQAVEGINEVKSDIATNSETPAPATTQPLETLEKTQ